MTLERELIYFTKTPNFFGVFFTFRCDKHTKCTRNDKWFVLFLLIKFNKAFPLPLWIPNIYGNQIDTCHPSLF